MQNKEAVFPRVPARVDSDPRGNAGQESPGRAQLRIALVIEPGDGIAAFRESALRIRNG